MFRQLVLARVIESASKQDSLRVLDEAGMAGPSYPTLNRRLPAWAEDSWRQGLPEARAAHARPGPASPVPCDVAALCFEAGQGRFPLMASAFEGNRAEVKTMLPLIEKFTAAHQLPDVTVAADAGMISGTSQKAIEAAGLSFIPGMKIPDVPCQVMRWHREHPGEAIPTGTCSSSPGPPGRPRSAATR